MDYLPGGYLSRTICDVLEEMRKCNETRNYAPMSSLIEEVQIMGNRMEAKLSDRRDYHKLAKILRDIIISKRPKKNDEVFQEEQ